MLPRKPPKPAVLRFGGHYAQRYVDPTQWMLVTDQGLGPAESTSFVHVKNRNIYAALVAKRLVTERALPSSFDRPRQSRAAGVWHNLLNSNEQRQREEL